MSDMLFDPLLGNLQRVLDLRSQQHALTASNLANSETPGYRAKMLDFEKILGDVFDESMALESGDGAAERSWSEPDVVELEPAPWAADDNSVLAERETARMKANALMYRAISRGTSRRLAMLKYAANDGK
jgi:flagellar basal-body rod protein FlgB